jgi:hypothetical protein
VGREKEMRLFESLGSSKVISCQQGVLMEMGSIDLIDYQVSNAEIPYCQVGKGEKMRPCESLMNSEVIEEDQKSILMIGEKEVFLPHHLVDAKNCVFDATTAEGQPIVTVREKEELEQTSKSAPAEEEHSAEMLKIFSQEAEQDITIALEAAAEEDHEDKMLTPWEMELEMLKDWLNHPEKVDDWHE